MLSIGEQRDAEVPDSTSRAEAAAGKGCRGLTHPLVACASGRRPGVNGMTSPRQSARWASDAFSNLVALKIRRQGEESFPLEGYYPADSPGRPREGVSVFQEKRKQGLAFWIGCPWGARSEPGLEQIKLML